MMFPQVHISKAGIPTEAFTSSCRRSCTCVWHQHLHNETKKRRFLSTSCFVSLVASRATHTCIHAAAIRWELMGTLVSFRYLRRRGQRAPTAECIFCSLRNQSPVSLCWKGFWLFVHCSRSKQPFARGPGLKRTAPYTVAVRMSGVAN